jgi:hypothetical protein
VIEAMFNEMGGYTPEEQRKWVLFAGTVEEAVQLLEIES